MISNCDHQEHLLELVSGDTRRSWRSGKKATVAVLALGSASMVGVLGGLRYSAQGKAIAEGVDRRSGEGNSTELSMLAYTPSCYGYTGGTCATSACNAEREATCDTGKCVCADGCTGADGTCRSDTYTEVGGQPFTLSNVYWPNYELYIPQVSAMTPMSVSNMPTVSFLGAQMFKLYELPGTKGGKKQYFLASNKWPGWVAAVGLTPPYAAYAYNLDHRIAPWDPQGVVVNVCDMSPHGEEGAVKIGSTGEVNHWFYMQHTSWNVAASSLSNDPGSTGYWKPEPPLEGLDACE